jgi:hypothetical protein
MAEKRVSVRLVAEGGRQVRAELEGIGEAGAKGLGRLSSEMELANARLGSFARKAGIALAAVTAAAAAAGVAMVRSGLDVIGAQADMAASLKTTVESLQVLTWAGELAGVSMGEIEQATKKLTTRLSEAAAGSGSAVGALQRLNLTAAELQALPLDQRIVASSCPRPSAPPWRLTYSVIAPHWRSFASTRPPCGRRHKMCATSGWRSTRPMQPRSNVPEMPSPS